MAILEVKDLKKTFKQTPVIKGISFDMAEGEILGILGPNGAGKTTTLQMILGILTPTSGTVTIFGQNMPQDKTSIMERVNFSSTYTDLPWRLTVRENLIWTSYLYNIPDRARRLDKIKTIFRLDKLWNQSTSSLSAGQRTRVNLARAYVNFPQLLLPDEPTASLDPEVAAYIREFFADQRTRFNTSIILTSHNMTEVENLCDRVLILKNGRIIGNDTPGRLAKKIDETHLNLRVTKRADILAQLIETSKLKSVETDGVTSITLKEKLLPLFLYEVAKNKIHYSEITIDKPTLEDYFLRIAKGKDHGKSTGGDL